MPFLDTTIVVSIIGFLILIIWAKAMKKDVKDVLYDIKEFLGSFRTVEE